MADRSGYKGAEYPKDKPQPRLKKIERKQTFLRVVDIDRLVEDDHEVRALWEILGRMNMSRYYEYIRAVDGVAGREPVNPQLLISLWIYAYSQGVSSAREISRLCKYHPAYQWLCGMEEINYHTLSDFRVKHKEALDALFIEVLGVLSAEGLIGLEQVMHDGTKIKAFASSDSFRREGRILEHLELARQQVLRMSDPRLAKELGPKVTAAKKRAAQEKQKRLELAMEELEKLRAIKFSAVDKAKARVSWSDPEARVMKHGDGGYAPSYNTQLSTDAKNGVIVGVGVSQSRSDYKELLPSMKRVEKQMGEKPKQMVVDGGFISRENILAMSNEQVDLIGSLSENVKQSAGQMKRRGVAESFYPKNFKYDESNNIYTCPAGKTLRYESKEGGVGVIIYKYRASGTDCLPCPFKKDCCPQKAMRGRSIARGVEDSVVAAFRAKMQTTEAKEIYKKRGAIAEFPNAWIKDKIKLRQFRLRGQIKVLTEVLWACITYNIKQWIRLRWKPRYQMSRMVTSSSI